MTRSVDRTPAEAAQDAYKKSKKLKRSAAIVADLLEEVRLLTTVKFAVIVTDLLEQMRPIINESRECLLEFRR